MGRDGIQWDAQVKSWEINGFQEFRGLLATCPNVCAASRNKTQDGVLVWTPQSALFFFCSHLGQNKTAADTSPGGFEQPYRPGGPGAWGRSRWPVSRVLSPAPYPCGRRSGDGHSSGTTVARRLARPTRAAGGNARRPMVSHGAGPPLFGLAPGGVCRATTVTGRAVRSYRTLSPLPGIRRTEARAVCFLLHCPWGRPRRALPGTVFPWSPDFPPRRAEARQSGHPAICCAACIGTGRADRKPIRPDSRRDVIR